MLRINCFQHNIPGDFRHSFDSDLCQIDCHINRLFAVGNMKERPVDFVGFRKVIYTFSKRSDFFMNCTKYSSPNHQRRSTDRSAMDQRCENDSSGDYEMSHRSPHPFENIFIKKSDLAQG